MIGFSDSDKELYPRISEEERVALYAADGIPYNPIGETQNLINLKYKEIEEERKHSDSSEERILAAIYGVSKEQLILELKEKAEAIENKIDLTEIWEEYGESTEYYDYAHNVLHYDILTV